MGEVQFTEEQFAAPRAYAPTEKFAAWLVEKKIARDMAQANLLLLGVAGLAIIVGLFFFFTGVIGDSGQLSEEERAQLEASTFPR